MSEILKFRLKKLNWVIKKRADNISFYKNNLNREFIMILNEDSSD